MAWSWSHTNEAYGNARDNLALKGRDWLETTLAEWQASRLGQFGDYHFRDKRYPKCLAYAKILSDDSLCDLIWERMEQHATCDNGGFNAWACPYGCHTVSFDCEEIEAA
jgi:hypothetical protein